MVMILNIVCAAVFCGLAFWMYFGAHFASTRRMAAVPLAACAVELLTVGLFTTSFAVVTALLIACRVAMVLCCLGEMNRDAVRYQRRRNRRASLARQMAYTEPLRAMPPVAVRVAAEVA